jgi:tetratricopeptide (TPR) repeat protein
MLQFSQKYLTLRTLPIPHQPRPMHRRSTLFPLATITLLFAASGAQANDYAPLIKAKKYAEAERLAATRLAREPNQAEALIGRVQAIMGASVPGRVGEAVASGKQCVAANPALAGCHLALGQALGWKAMTGGVMSSLGFAGELRDSLKKAVELEPRNMDARFTLLQFYMMAPGIMGGGTGKAEALAASTAALSAEAGKLMAAQLDLAGERLGKADVAVMAMRPGSDEHLNLRHEELLAGIGNTYLTEKKFTDAERVLRESQKRFPEGETAPYLLMRILQEQGKHREALAGFEQLLPQQPRARVHYRMGQSLQVLGDKARAASAFEKALSLKSGLSDKQRADAQAQLAALKS